MRFDNDRPVPEEEECEPQHDAENTIKDIDSILENTLNSDILYTKDIVEEECKLWIQQDKRTQQYVKCHQYEQGGLDIF